MITVVIASYKYGHLAAHCIESILSQTVKPDRILFVDDGIGDCNHLVYMYPEVEFILRKKNLGTVDNFQDMLDRVTTKRCMFLGADNWLRSDAIELLKEQDTDIVTYDIIVTGELREELSKRHSSEITRSNGDYYWSRKLQHHGSMLYNVELAKKFGYEHSGKTNSEEDYILWNNMIKEGATVSHVEEGLLYYRRHKENFNKYE